MGWWSGMYHSQVTVAFNLNADLGFSIVMSGKYLV